MKKEKKRNKKHKKPGFFIYFLNSRIHNTREEKKKRKKQREKMLVLLELVEELLRDGVKHEPMRGQVANPEALELLLGLVHGVALLVDSDHPNKEHPPQEVSKFEDVFSSKVKVAA